MTNPGDFSTLDPNFIQAMAEIGWIGTEKYSKLDYQKSSTITTRDSFQHAIDHMYAYKHGLIHDHLGSKKYHLAAAAFNLMILFYHCKD